MHPPSCYNCKHRDKYLVDHLKTSSTTVVSVRLILFRACLTKVTAANIFMSVSCTKAEPEATAAGNEEVYWI